MGPFTFGNEGKYRDPPFLGENTIDFAGQLFFFLADDFLGIPMKEKKLLIKF